MLNNKILAGRPWLPGAKMGSILNPLNLLGDIRKKAHFVAALSQGRGYGERYGLWKGCLYRGQPDGRIDVEGSHFFPFDLARNGFTYREVGDLANTWNQTLYCSPGKRGVVYQVSPNTYPVFVFSSDALFTHDLARVGYFKDELAAFASPLQDCWTRVNGTLYGISRLGEVDDCGNGSIAKPYCFHDHDIEIEAVEGLLSWYCLQGQTPVYARTAFFLVSASMEAGSSKPVLRRERYHTDLGLLS